MDTPKIFAQNAYEKIEMARRNPQDLSVMVAADTSKSGGYCLVLMVGSNPIAQILTQDHIDRLEPVFDKSEQINAIYNKASKIDSRKTPGEFNNHNDQVTELLQSGLIAAGYVPEEFANDNEIDIIYD